MLTTRIDNLVTLLTSAKRDGGGLFLTVTEVSLAEALINASGLVDKVLCGYCFDDGELDGIVCNQCCEHDDRDAHECPDCGEETNYCYDANERD